MAEYYISGVWKDTNGTITHYAVHAVHVKDGAKTWTQTPTKTNKTDAINLVSSTSNTVTTIVWNYTYGKWYIGKPVSIVDDPAGKYLKSAPDEKISDNLGHLICWNSFIA